MTAFGTIPAEPPRITSLGECCPRLQRDIPQVLAALAARGYRSIVRESLRTDERQQWLHGFGRLYDDDRGIVTNASTARDGWHFFGCAVDIVHALLEDQAPAAYWDALAEIAESFGLAAGRRWVDMQHGEGDRPHVQLGAPMRRSPSPAAIALYENGGNAAVWAEVGGL